jgi:hypothetical protein
MLSMEKYPLTVQNNTEIVNTVLTTGVPEHGMFWNMQDFNPIKVVCSGTQQNGHPVILQIPI